MGEIRRTLDPVAALGVPPHFTALFPFVRAGAVSERLLGELTDLFSGVAAFKHSLVSTAWFGEDVLWLRSDADDALRHLTEVLVRRWPEHPPYAGEHAQVVPHLTIAVGASVASMQAAEVAVRTTLPVVVDTTEVTLLVEESTGEWAVRARFPLGAA